MEISILLGCSLNHLRTCYDEDQTYVFNGRYRSNSAASTTHGVNSSKGTLPLTL